jgi:hypothetical protein
LRLGGEVIDELHRLEPQSGSKVGCYEVPAPVRQRRPAIAHWTRDRKEGVIRLVSFEVAKDIADCVSRRCEVRDRTMAHRAERVAVIERKAGIRAADIS